MVDHIANPLPDRRSNSLLEFFVHNHKAVNLLLLLLLVLGSLAIFNSTVERNQNYDPRAIQVSVPFDGATPHEIVEDINLRIEESLVGISGIDRITTDAFEGLAEVYIELEQFQDAVDTLDAVRTAVESIENFPPLGADEPEIIRSEVVRNVATLALSSESATEDELRKAAENLRDQLLLLPDISIVDLVGSREREVHIGLSEFQLRRYGLTIVDIVRILREFSLNLSGGELSTGSGDIVVSVLDKSVTGSDFEAIPIVTRPDGSIVSLNDIATIRDGFVEDPLLNLVNDVPAVFVTVRNPQGVDPSKVATYIESFLESYEVAPGLNLDLWIDDTFTQQKQITGLANTGMIGALFVFVLLLLLFDLRVGFWIAFGVPTVIISSFIGLYVLGISINMMSVMGIALIIGIVVDDAVIVGENIQRYKEEGVPATEAVLRGTREMIGPVVVGALTTAFAFAALLPLDGALGQIFASLGVVVIVILLMSLVDTFYILPAHLDGDQTWSLWPLKGIQQKTSRAINHVLQTRMLPAVRWCVQRPITTTLGGSLVFVGAVALVVVDLVRINTFQNRLDEHKIQVDLIMVVGTPFQTTAKAVDQIVAAAHQANRETGGTAVGGVNVMVGQLKTVEQLMGATDRDPASHLASVQLRLNTLPTRKVTVLEFKHAWIRNIGDIPGADKVSFPTGSQQIAPSTSFIMRHPDEAQVTMAATELKELLVAHPWFYEVQDTLELGDLRYEISLTEKGLASGLTAGSLAAQLKSSFFGAEVQRIVRNQEELQVMVRYPLQQRSRLFDILDERIRLPNGERASFSDVARITQNQDFAQLQRVDSLPSVTITAFYETEATSSRAVGDLVFDDWFTKLTQKYPGLSLLPDGTSYDQLKMVRMLAISFPLALLGMFVLVAIQLRSFIQPFYVLVGIPVALAGSIFMHLILGYDFSLVSIFGFVAATGVVVNDSLVLLDRYNKILLESPTMNVVSAIIDAARTRIRPIVLTTATTVVGVAPILYSKAESLDFLIQILVSMMGGLVAGTFGTLLVLPALVVLVEKIKGVVITRIWSVATS